MTKEEVQRELCRIAAELLQLVHELGKEESKDNDNR